MGATLAWCQRGASGALVHCPDRPRCQCRLLLLVLWVLMGHYSGSKRQVPPLPWTVQLVSADPSLHGVSPAGNASTASACVRAVRGWHQGGRHPCLAQLPLTPGSTQMLHLSWFHSFLATWQDSFSLISQVTLADGEQDSGKTNRMNTDVRRQLYHRRKSQAQRGGCGRVCLSPTRILFTGGNCCDRFGRAPPWTACTRIPPFFLNTQMVAH